MKTMSDARACRELIARLERLSPEARPLWGTMTAPQMLAHLAGWMRMAKGELKASPRMPFMRYPPLKQLIIYWLPFPKGVQTAPELIISASADWAIEQTTVREDMLAFQKMHPNGLWPEHPVFGRMTPKAWGVFAYRHTDHHLRQFGV